MEWLVFGLPPALLWLGVLLVPWRPWQVRDSLEAAEAASDALEDVTVIVPARNEAELLAATLDALRRQGHGVRILVVDDDSDDSTAEVARTRDVEVIAAGPLPDGWAGKLWALEGGRREATTPLVALVDADIRLRPGTLATMRARLRAEGLQLVSLMARLRMDSVWERLLLPAFVYFFGLIYPFRLANGRSRRVAAAAGGCILLEAAALEGIGGFSCLRGALIDDCTLAARIKQSGGRTWIGLTHSAISTRRYDRLGEIWDMVARSAFAQLHHSFMALLICTVLMVLAFWQPVIGLLVTRGACAVCAGALVAMAGSYLPTLRYYGRSPWWCLTLPLVAALFLAMTWSSAWRYWRGEGAHWKGRLYRRS